MLLLSPLISAAVFLMNLFLMEFLMGLSLFPSPSVTVRLNTCNGGYTNTRTHMQSRGFPLGSSINSRCKRPIRVLGSLWELHHGHREVNYICSHHNWPDEIHGQGLEMSKSVGRDFRPTGDNTLIEIITINIIEQTLTLPQ